MSDLDPLDEANPVPWQVRAAAWAAFQRTVTSLLRRPNLLTSAGLDDLRTTMRTGDWARTSIPAAMHDQHAVLLDAICRSLAGIEQWRLDYYQGAGDLLPAAPDDASSLLGDVSQ